MFAVLPSPIRTRETLGDVNCITDRVYKQPRTTHLYLKSDGTTREISRYVSTSGPLNLRVGSL